MLGESHALSALLPVPTEWGDGVALHWSGHCREEKNLLHRLGIEPCFPECIHYSD